MLGASLRARQALVASGPKRPAKYWPAPLAFALLSFDAAAENCSSETYFPLCPSKRCRSTPHTQYDPNINSPRRVDRPRDRCRPMGRRRRRCQEFFIGQQDRPRRVGPRSPNLPTADQERSMKFRPLHDRVVVKRVEAESKTASGIIIPDNAKEKPSEGEVVAVGPGGRDEAGKLIPIDVKTGDRVLFGKWSGTEVKLDGVEYLIMKESDIMGVLVDAQARKKAA